MHSTWCLLYTFFCHAGTGPSGNISLHCWQSEHKIYTTLRYQKVLSLAGVWQSRIAMGLITETAYHHCSDYNKLNPSLAKATLVQCTRSQSFLKASKPCHVGTHWIALTEYSQMSTYLTGFQVICIILYWQNKLPAATISLSQHSFSSAKLRKLRKWHFCG